MLSDIASRRCFIYRSYDHYTPSTTMLLWQPRGISRKGNLPEIQFKQVMTYFRNLKWTFFDIAGDSSLQNDPLYHCLHDIPHIPCAASRMGSTPNIHHSLGPSFSPGKERHCKSWTPSLRVKHILIRPPIRSSLPRWFNDWFASNELMWFATQPLHQRDDIRPHDEWNLYV